jgi:hypothetical protein
MHQVGQYKIVEADHGNRSLRLKIMQRPDRAERHQVVRCEERRRRMSTLHEAVHSGVASARTADHSPQ